MATLAQFIFLLLLGVSTATKPRHPTKSFESWFSVDQPPPLPFEAVQSVVDFPPDGFVARHTHGGPLYAVMIHGSTILWIVGEPAKLSHQGDPFVEPYGAISSAADSGTGHECDWKFAGMLQSACVSANLQEGEFDGAGGSGGPKVGDGGGWGSDGMGTFTVGEFWIERPGAGALVSGNSGDETAVVAVTIVGV